MIAFIQADALHLPLADKSVHCCVTSPPYFGLRDYGVSGQIGLEKTPEEFVAKMVAVFREVRRVLKDDGTLWLNLGDSYASGKGSCFNPGGGTSSLGKDRKAAGAHPLHRGNKSDLIDQGRKPKDLLGIPWLVAFALQADGWYLRSDIIWSKPNCMPGSQRDRPTMAHEHIFLLTKKPRYFYDHEAVKEKSAGVSGGDSFGKQSQDVSGTMAQSRKFDRPDYATRAKRSVWTVPSHAFKGAHFATFPPKLILPCIQAGTSEKGACPACGNQWARVTGEKVAAPGRGSGNAERKIGASDRTNTHIGSSFPWKPTDTPTTGWRPTCKCGLDPIPSTVLDPFSGAGTTALVCHRLGRSAVGIELSPKFIRMAQERIERDSDRKQVKTRSVPSPDQGELF